MSSTLALERGSPYYDEHVADCRSRVKNRLKSGEGMSFSEFSYPILQAWDWWHMYNTKGIQMQIGGADQFGNIVAGIDAVKYIAKTHHNPDVRQEKEDPKMVPFGFTVPLLTTAAGQKFGKTAGNAIWLDKEMTSCFDLYQVVDPTSLQPHSTTLTACL